MKVDLNENYNIEKYKILIKGGVIIPRLENWSIISVGDEFQVPEMRAKQLHGEIYDDEYRRFEDGVKVQTSTLVELNLKNNYAKTLNTQYILGEPSKDYLEWLKKNNIFLDV